VNAACHRNYFELGSRIMIEIFDDRVDIVSPGGVCKGITPENFGTISITRNPLVQSMFYRIDYIEQMGTGIMRMKEAAKEADIAEPKFELENFFRVTFKRPPLPSVTSSGSQAVASDTQATLSDTQATLSDRKSAIISYLETHGKASSSNIAGFMGVTNNWVRTILRQMVDDGTIEKIGNNRYTHYELTRQQ